VFLALSCVAITGETGMLSYRACTLPSNGHSMAYMLQYLTFLLVMITSIFYEIIISSIIILLIILPVSVSVIGLIGIDSAHK
jgi:hypothetical protein